MKNKYQRAHLRAPCFTTILYADQDYVFKAKTLNISEGGMLLDSLPHFPDSDLVPMMVFLPQYPPFLNFSLEKLSSFSQDIFPAKILRVKSQMVRKFEDRDSSAEDVFQSRLGLYFTEVGREEQRIIADYVTVFTANIVYLQTLLESINSDHQALEKAKLLGRILGYQTEGKISQFKLQVNHDYKSLEWL